VIPEIHLVVCANAADNADNGWLGITDVWLATTDRFECDAIIISCARAGRAGGVLSISIEAPEGTTVAIKIFQVSEDSTNNHPPEEAGNDNHNRKAQRWSVRHSIAHTMDASIAFVKRRCLPPFPPSSHGPTACPGPSPTRALCTRWHSCRRICST
jgi:hypothetical protein